MRAWWFSPWAYVVSKGSRGSECGVNVVKGKGVTLAVMIAERMSTTAGELKPTCPLSILGKRAAWTGELHESLPEPELPERQSNTVTTCRFQIRRRTRAQTARNVSIQTPRERRLRLEPARQARKVGREPRQHRHCGFERNWTEWRTHTIGMFKSALWGSCTS